MTVNITPDGNGFLAEILEHPTIYAFGESEKDALKELSCVIEMMGESFVFEKNISQLSYA